MKKIFKLFIIFLAFVPLVSVSAYSKVSCGNVTGIPEKIPSLTSFAVTLVQIAVPVILVVMGTMDLMKGITAGKEDEIKKGQKLFVKRLVMGALIFFVIVAVKFIVSFVADATTTNNISKCIDCFLRDDCSK